MLVLGPPPVVIQEDRRAESRFCVAPNGPTTMYDGINAHFAGHNVVAYFFLVFLRLPKLSGAALGRGEDLLGLRIPSPWAAGVAVHAKGRKWQRGEGGKEMVAMGGGRAAKSRRRPPRRRDVHRRKGCTRNVWAVPARSSLPRRDEFRCAGWLAGVYRAQAVQDVARGRSVRSLVERIWGAGCAAYTTGWSPQGPLHDETGWGISEFTMASISPGWAGFTSLLN
ncbi:hypothetical protein B0H14DRAFT_2606148 [Mycena olivaceomarginata]|nr:hypothetical protein B0H14DRAFT_2606148 [Mycena olivaceomarginata]